MIALWRTSGFNGQDLYGPSVREGIERELYGSVRALPPYPMQRPVVPPPSPYLTPESVTAVLNTTLDAKNRDCIARPYDGPAREQLGVLLRIRDLLGSGRLTQDELQAIMKQLRELGTAPPPPVPTPQPVVFTPQPSYATPVQTVSPPAPKLPPFPPSLPHDPYRAPQIPVMPPPAASHQYQGPVPPPVPISTPVASSTPLPAPTAVVPLIPANVADILRNLNTSGLLSAPKTPEIPAPKPEPRTALDEYEDHIVNLGLKLTSIDLNTYA
jgi:pre-mRNA cleavage complex 2 protein Pcf11